MFARVTVLLALAAAIPAWSQVEPSATGGVALAEDDTQMMAPPPVSGTLYPNVVGLEARSNYLSAALTVDGAYIDNLLPGISTKPAADATYSILPTLTLDRTTSRQKVTLTYSPDYTLYRPTSALDAVDHSAAATFLERATPRLTISLQDYFLRTSNVFNQSYPFSSGGIGGTTQTPNPAAIAPFAEQMTNTANAVFTYQFAANGMLGAGGLFSDYRFPNSANTLGLYESDGSGGSAFYNRRMSRLQYAGFMYEYARVLAYPPNAQVESQTHSFLPFYTVYFNRTFSLSISAGTQYVDVAQSQQRMSSTWSPAAMISMGWQGDRGDIAASYLHTVVSGEGLLGAFNSNSANLAGTLKFARTWTGAASFSYDKIQPVTPIQAVTPLFGLTYQGGNSLTAHVSLERSMGEHFSVECGYDRLHEDYSGIAVISQNPDSDREFVTLTYQFSKPLGR